jgi:HK97 family phage major capsid protein
MTTPAAPPVTTGSFQRVLWPADVVNRVINLLVGGSPFASALTRYPTGRSEVAFPTAKPDRPAWVPEMGDIPIIGLGDDADIVALAKLASIVLLSNEAVDDASVNLTAQLGDLLRDSSSAELDRGLLYGEDTPEPRGVVASAPAADGADLAAALTAAIGQVGDNGGTVTHLAAKPSVLADARNLRDNEGRMMYPAGLGQAFGVTEVGVPELKAADILAFDQSRCWLILRSDFQIETSRDFAFERDATAVRIKGRFAVGIPALDKSIRKLVVTSRQAAPQARGKAA